MSVDGRLGYFPILTIMNYASENILLQVFVGTYIFISLGHIPRSGTAGSRGMGLHVIIWKTARLFSNTAALFHIPTKCMGVPIYPQPFQRLLLLTFWLSPF